MKGVTGSSDGAARDENGSSRDYGQLADRKRGDLIDQLNEFILSVVTENDIKKIADKTMEKIAGMFRITEMVMTLWDDELKRFTVLSSFGYPLAVAQEVMGLEYTREMMAEELREEFRISKNGYYIRAEEWHLTPEDEFLIDHPELVDVERKDPAHWAEMDFFHFALRDHEEQTMGYLELNDSEGEILPTVDELRIIEVMVEIAGLALENATNLSTQRKMADTADLIATLITRDVGRLAKGAVQEIASVARQRGADAAARVRLESAERGISQISRLAESVRKYQEMTRRPYSLVVRLDLCKTIRIILEQLRSDPSSPVIPTTLPSTACLTKADSSINDLLTTAIDVVSREVTKAKRPELSVSLKPAEAGQGKFWAVCISSADVDLKSWKKIKLDMKSIESSRRRYPEAANLFGLFLMRKISERFGGKVAVDDMSIESEKPSLVIYLPLEK